MSFVSNMKAIMLTVLLSAATTVSGESTCHGTTDNGRLEDGVRLPMSGENFKSYGMAPWIAGRTYVHSTVRDVVIDAYNRLANEFPDHKFKYAETGHEDGGRFDPHKTHQNGLSVDFIVPVENEGGASAHLFTHPLNRYGYDIDFDDTARYGGYKIDFDALGAHIVALHKAAQSNDIEIWRVLFDPRFQSQLYGTRYGAYIRENVTIPNKRSWVRHDDHYHVDFSVSCQRKRR